MYTLPRQSNRQRETSLSHNLQPAKSSTHDVPSYVIMPLVLVDSPPRLYALSLLYRDQGLSSSVLLHFKLVPTLESFLLCAYLRTAAILFILNQRQAVEVTKCPQGNIHTIPSHFVSNNKMLKS